MFVKVSDNLVKLPKEKADILRKKGFGDGRDVTIGIRPEDLWDSPEMLEKFKDSTVHGTVEVYEMLGSTSNLYVDIDGHQVTAKVEPDTKKRVGDTVTLAFDNNKIHVFDNDTNENLLVDLDPVTGELLKK